MDNEKKTDEIDLENMPLEEMYQQTLTEDGEDNKTKLAKDKKFRCPLCGEILKGRRGLNIHLRRSHFNDDKKSGRHMEKKNLSDKKDWSRDQFDKKNELKIQDVLVKTVFGASNVHKVESEYAAGKYTMKDLPIDISYYLRLKGVKPEKKETPDSEEKTKEVEKTPETVSVNRFLKMLAQKSEDGSDWSETILGIKKDENSYLYISDLIFDDSEKTLNIKDGLNKDKMLDVGNAVRYLEKFISDNESRKGYLLRSTDNATNVIQKTKGNKRWIIIEIENGEKND